MVSRVTYIVKRDGGSVTRLVHLNKTQRYHDRPMSVSSACIVAEESDVLEAALQRPQGLCSEPCRGYIESDLQTVLEECKACFGEAPGLCKTGTCKIEVIPGSDIVSSLPPPTIQCPSL